MSEVERFESFCHCNNIVINFVTDLSTRVRGYCYYDGEYYNIMLNAKLTGEQLQKTTIHEIIHVLENHFHYPTHMVEIVEEEVEDLIDSLYKEFIVEFSYA